MILHSSSHSTTKRTKTIHKQEISWLMQTRAYLALYLIISLDEILTVLLVRGGKALSIEAGRKILEDARIDLLQIDTEIFDKAWLVYQSFKDKQWSFTDCTSYVLMKNLAIHTGASFDNHFDQFGFITVPK